MQHGSYNLIVILGPTASGKTRLAARLARYLDSSVISADSRQVYRRMNIGTGKDYQEYIVEGKAVPYHLIDIAEPGEKYHVHRYAEDFYRIFRQVSSEETIPVLCGGTGLYIDAILRDLSYTGIPNNTPLREELSTKTREELLETFNRMQPTSFTAKADTSTAKRLVRAIEICDYLLHNAYVPEARQKIRPVIFGIDPPVPARNERIEERLKSRLKSGLTEEVKSLLRSGLTHEQLTYYGLEYKFVAMHLSGEISYEALVELLNIAIRQFAKRQMTYFRKMMRDGHVIHWINPLADTGQQLEEILSVLHSSPENEL